MEMSPNTVSSALLLWSLWLLLSLAPIIQTTLSAPASGPSLLLNTTLLFNSGAPGCKLQNCSCSTPVQDCDEALAMLLCKCHTVSRSTLPRTGLRYPGHLVVWVKDLWVLEELLNGSMVSHLHLSFCGMKPLDSRYLALLGLQTLRVHSAAPGVPYPNQEMNILSAGVAVELEARSFDFSSFSVTIMDVAVLNGLSSIKAYSVIGPPASVFSQHFPHLTIPLSLLSPSTPADHSEQPAKPLHNLLITFVY
ncbi:uncharacterized protein C21orf62-like [Solea solea]|uniref:uncharacterized protein C21orf62-like n=1 Tax=Solea solea TaxID=90069 RepID=UPI00272B89AB|nr:uncharacterized protein C21orf62-like [Solea solea]